MNIGDYVRTRDGKIGKITSILTNEDDELYSKFYIDIEGYADFKFDIFDFDDNPCSDIIDLIEVGDYVNGECVISVDSIEVYTRDGMYLNEDIKSIITKEQFSSMEYKVGE